MSEFRLALDDALKRMPIFAGEGGHMRCLRLGLFVRVGPALAASLMMDPEHERHRALTIHVEDLLQHPRGVLAWFKGVRPAVNEPSGVIRESGRAGYAAWPGGLTPSPWSVPPSPP